MTEKEVVKKIESYVQEKMSKEEESHGFRHVERVRKWALKIGKIEGGVDLFLLEVAALLHDIGRIKETKKISHDVAGEKMARGFLSKLNFFSPAEIDLLCFCVLKHGAGDKQAVGTKKKLLQILQDADRMDMWGATSIVRTTNFLPDKPLYINRQSFKLKKLTRDQVNQMVKNGQIHKSIIDNLVINLSCYDHANTKAARRLARDKVNYLRNFLKQLQKETVDL